MHLRLRSKLYVLVILPQGGGGVFPPLPSGQEPGCVSQYFCEKKVSARAGNRSSILLPLESSVTCNDEATALCSLTADVKR
jgi:hypothetical protein